ncbi:hypothetical protein [Actinoplanes sp. NPDC051851]|uniref:hypothetical protein n=1 Tax=Actinoplanes sp. NPDC051851 TaxID=3154753 RepID=UPI00341BBAB7
MLESQFDRLRSEVGDAVRQPDFGTVRSRAGAIRRRRAVTSAAAVLAVVLGAAGAGYAGPGAPDEPGLADVAPVVTASPGEVWFPSTSVTNAGSSLFRVFERCRECDAELWVSSDGGGSWERGATPPAPSDAAGPRTATLLALAPGLVLWQEHRTLTVAEVQAMASSGAGSPVDLPWITRDGGVSWQRVVVGTEPVAAVPSGVRPVDCAVVAVPTCAIGVIDPVTGRFAPLAVQPAGITVQQRWAALVNVPLGGGLWVPGRDPVTNRPAVATSADAGRTWHTQVFTGAVPAVLGSDGTAAAYYLPKVAAGPGGAAYVLTFRADGVVDVHYTADGGSTWRDGATVGDPQGSAGFVTADGAHVVIADTGLVAARGTGRYAPVALPGYPVAAGGYPVDPGLVQVAAGKAAVPYLVDSDDGPYVSGDGRTWRLVRLP